MTKRKETEKVPETPQPEEWGDDNRLGYRCTQAAYRVLNMGAEPYCDEVGACRLRLPAAKEGQVGPRRSFLIRSREMTAWLAALFYDQDRLPLLRRELEDMLFILEGKALENVVPSELEDTVEREPVLETVLALCDSMNAGKEWEGTATELLAELRSRAEQIDLHLSHHENWPQDGSHLSCKLRQYSAQLVEAGVKHTMYRNKGQRVHTLRRY